MGRPNITTQRDSGDGAGCNLLPRVKSNAPVSFVAQFARGCALRSLLVTKNLDFYFFLNRFLPFFVQLRGPGHVTCNVHPGCKSCRPRLLVLSHDPR